MKIYRYVLFLIVISELVFQQASPALAAEQPCSPDPLYYHYNKGYQHSSIMASLLGWVASPESKTLCGGYYQEPFLGILGTSNTDLIQVSADQGDTQLDGAALLKGHVRITQPGRFVSSDRVSLFRDPKTGELTLATLSGHVQLREPGQLIVGDNGHLQLKTLAGDFRHVLYRVSVAVQALQPKPAGWVKIQSLTARGTADELQQTQKGHLQLWNATYSTCPPDVNSWGVSAAQINLNHDTGRGTARNAILRVKDIPVLYTPYFNFPIDKRRQSGFLTPSYSTSTLGGAALYLPYYFNLAPNYDFVLAPALYSLRGAQLNGTLRYLFPRSAGTLLAGYLPNDLAFSEFIKQARTQYRYHPALGRLLHSSVDRHYLIWRNTTQLSENWTGNVDYTTVSDDYYLQDFGGIPTAIISNQLLQQAKVSYVDTHWNLQGVFQGYKTLHPVNQALVENSYSRLPQLLAEATYPDEAYGLSYQLSNEFVHFTRRRNPGETRFPPTGERLNIAPSVSLPLMNLSGYLTPTFKLQLTEYNIVHQPNTNMAREITRAVPITSIEGGLYFERAMKWLGHDYQQTLEPQAFYLYVPYVNQNNIPLFDTALQPFNYDQLFRANRFTGIDRIGDAHQVSLGLSTRLLNTDTGEEKLRVSIGQIYYFQNRQVTLCNTSNCQDRLLVGATSSTSSSSPIAALLSYYINPVWNLTGNVTWDPKIRNLNNAMMNFQYRPLDNHVVNIGYNFVQSGDVMNTADLNSPQNNFNQANMSFAWPLNIRWKAVGSMNYNISHRHTQTYFYGVEYDNCCWAVRIVKARNFIGLSGVGDAQFNNTVYLQLQLKGLANVAGNDPTRLLISNIPGYSGAIGD